MQFTGLPERAVFKKAVSYKTNTKRLAIFRGAERTDIAAAFEIYHLVNIRLMKYVNIGQHIAASKLQNCHANKGYVSRRMCKRIARF